MFERAYNIANDMFISFFQLTFISLPRKLMKTTYILNENNLTLFYFIFVIKISYA